MQQSFRAFRIHRTDGKTHAQLEQVTPNDLGDGDLLVQVEYSGINYKDALAATGTGPIARKFPLICGIDLAGEVIESSSPRFSPGDKVLSIGAGQGETRDGGYAEFVRIDSGSAELLPETLNTRSAMALGTAGFTAAVAIHRMEHNGQSPSGGPILVTGATGGVGSVAINLLSSKGYQVAALTGKTSESPYLEALGAHQIVDRKTLEIGTKPLEHADWGGAIDNLGGDILAWLTRTVKPNGNIASIGLAAGAKLETTVMPFILRGVNLLGINMEVAPEFRSMLWQRLGDELQPQQLDLIVTREVTLSELPDCFEAYMRGAITGRTVVQVRE
jgi:acrylyl-CoA reductase (NADPH)